MEDNIEVVASQPRHTHAQSVDCRIILLPKPTAEFCLKMEKKVEEEEKVKKYFLYEGVEYLGKSGSVTCGWCWCSCWDDVDCTVGVGGFVGRFGLQCWLVFGWIFSL